MVSTTELIAQVNHVRETLYQVATVATTATEGDRVKAICYECYVHLLEALQVLAPAPPTRTHVPPEGA